MIYLTLICTATSGYRIVRRPTRATKPIGNNQVCFCKVLHAEIVVAEARGNPPDEEAPAEVAPKGDGVPTMRLPPTEAVLVTCPATVVSEPPSTLPTLPIDPETVEVASVPAVRVGLSMVVVIDVSAVTETEASGGLRTNEVPPPRSPPISPLLPALKTIPSKAVVPPGSTVKVFPAPATINELPALKALTIRPLCVKIGRVCL